jgi:hypothetical protein
VLNYSTEQHFSPTDLPELRNVYTEHQASERRCPLSVARYCEGSACMGWVWDPVGQCDARSARGRCGMVAAVPLTVK